MATGVEETRHLFPLSEREFVILMGAVMALNSFAIDAMLPALPEIAASLHVSDAKHAQFVLVSYVVGSAMGSLIAGSLSDRLGRRPLLLASIGCCALMGLVCAITPSFSLLIGARFIHGVAASALGVLSISVVRDRFSGDRMARIVSLVMLVLMTVPVLAPSLGQLVIMVAGWREIFHLLAAYAVVLLAWVAFRLPETLPAARRQSFSPSVMMRSWRTVATHRLGLGYSLGSGIMTGSLFGFLVSAQPIISGVFDSAAIFPLVFACVAGSAAIANFLNSRIVERFGARRVSHTALVMAILLGLAQLMAGIWRPDSLVLFLTLVGLSVAMVGLGGANLGAIAMEPFGDIAGLASSFQTCMRMALGGAIGAFTGQRFDGTTIPLAEGFLVGGALALCCILWAEHGKLFTRPNSSRPSAIE